MFLLNMTVQKWCANVCNFFCVSTGHDKQCHTFIECAKYSFLECPDGDPETDLTTGNRIVSLPSASSVIVPVTAIKRKVILYPRVDPQWCTVIDFQGPGLPRVLHKLIVPFYLVVDDMIWVNGSDPEPWLAKVLTVQSRTKMVRLHYYVSNGDNLFTPELNHCLDHVHWDTILGCDDGEWRVHQWESYN